MSSEEITIKAFRAIDDRERCVRYLMEHTRVLEDIGVSSVIRPDITWCTDPNVIVIVAEHPILGMVAGIRLHKARLDQELPLQQALTHFDPNAGSVLSAMRPGGNGEICGLWNAHRFAGRGVPMLLMEATISLANQMHLSSLVTFIAEYVASYAANAGFTMMSELVNGGDYVYPVASIRTYAMSLTDPLTLACAKESHRQRIVSLRMRPTQQRVEQPKRTRLDVRYELIIDQSMSEFYDLVSRWWQIKAA